METIDDDALQAWFIRTRGAAGIRIVGLREARRELLTALRDGVSVGLVGDRDLTGGGLPVTLFGAPAMLPLGPAMLTVESGAPAYVVAVRRVGIGRYRGGVELIPAPPEGSRRERVTATMAAMAAAFERSIATAPEQWWAVFFPIWPDLEAAVAATPAPVRAERTEGRRVTSSTRASATERSPADRVRPRHDPADAPRPRRPPHPHRRERRHGRRRGDPRPRRATDRPRCHRHHRPRADRRGRSPLGRWRATAGLRAEVVVGEEVTTRGGHLLALYIDRPIRPYRSLRDTIIAVHDAGGLAVPAHPLVPYPLCAQGFVLRGLLEDSRSAGPSRRPRDAQPDDARPPVARPGRPFRRPATVSPTWATATPTPSRRSGPAGRHSRAPTPRRLRRAIETRATEHGGSFHGTAGQFGVFGRQLRKRAEDTRAELRGRLLRDGTGRDHGYPGGHLRPPRYEPADDATRPHGGTGAGRAPTAPERSAR